MIMIRSATTLGYEPAEEGDGVTLQFPGKARGVVQKGLSPTLMCCMGGGNGVVVRSDNMTEKQPIKAGDLKVSQFGQANTVHSIDGVAPTITTCHVGIGQPKIEVVGDLNLAYDKDSMVHGTGGLSPAVTTKNSGHAILDKSETIPELQDGEVASMITPGRMEKRQNGKRYKTDGNSFTVTCQDKHGVIKNDNGKLRIRYLTPRECWRLQGFPDWAFDAAKDAGMSKSSLYKQAGNSIAVPCLKAIFKGMFIDKTFHKTQDITRWF